MSITGRLEDVPTVDVLSMLHLSGRNGELVLTSAAGTARFVFRKGAIVSASCPALGRTLGQLLCARAGIVVDAIDRALALQRETKLPLGRILVEQGIVTRPVLHDAVTALIRDIVAEVCAWRAGSFEFVVSEAPAVDDVAVVPEGAALDSGLDVKDLLSSAVRRFDERSSSATPMPAVAEAPKSPSGKPVASTQAARVERPSQNPTPRVVVLVTDDGIFANLLRSAWSERGVPTRTYALEQEAARQVAELLGTGADVVCVLHADGMGQRGALRSTLSVARRFKSAFPRVPIVVTGDVHDEARHELLRHGVRAVVPLPVRAKDPAAFRAAFAQACAELTANAEGAFLELAGSDSFVDGATNDLRRLAERVEGLHRSTENAAVALALLDYVAENVERAVFFLCRKSDVIAISAFGRSAADEPMRSVTPGLSIRLDEAPVVRSVVEQGRSVRALAAAEELQCEALFRRIGRPRSGAALWIPVRSLERVFAVLYADNGERMRPLVSTEALQILACQAGLMLENMALLRRASKAVEARVEQA